MKIISAKLTRDEVSFQPEMEVLLRIPMELQTKEYTQEESFRIIGESFHKAYDEFKKSQG